MWVFRQIRDRLQPKFDVTANGVDPHRCPSPTGCLVHIARPVTGGTGRRHHGSCSDRGAGMNNSGSLAGSRAPTAADDDGVSVRSGAGGGGVSRCLPCRRGGRSREGEDGGSGGGFFAALVDVCKSMRCCDRCRAPRCKWWKSVCSRVYLIAINLASFVGGWSLIALAIWLHVHRDSFSLWPVFRDNPTSPLVAIDQVPVVLAVVGLFFAVMSFLGCCGACTDSVCFLGFYTLFLVCVIILEATVGVLTTALKQQMNVSLLDSMRYQVQREYNRTALGINRTDPHTLRLTQAWDSLQTKLNCCGVDGPQDYVNSSWFNSTRDLDGVFVPASCCAVVPRRKVINENFCQVAAILFPVSINESTFLNTQGCHQAVLKYIDSYTQTVFGLPLPLLILLQVVALVLTCILLRYVRLKHSDYWWYVAEDCE